MSETPDTDTDNDTDSDTLTEPRDERPGRSPLPGPVERASGLTRSREDRYLGGVGGGVSRHLGVDPLLVRVVLAVLGLFGVGIVLYVALWILLPDDADGTAAWRTSSTTRGWLVVGAVGLSGLFLLGPVVGTGDGGLLVFGALLVAVVLLVRDRRARRSGRAATGPVPAYAGPDAPPSWAPPPPRAGRPRRTGPVLLLPALATTAVAWGALGLLEAGGVDVRASIYPAVGLTVVGVLLVVGAWRGRPLLLGLLGFVMAVALGITTAAEAGAFDPEVTAVAPTSAAGLPRAADFGSGTYELDLLGVDPADLAGRSVAVSGDVGEITVLLPRSVPVHLVAVVDVVGEVALREVVSDDDVPGVTSGVPAGRDLGSSLGCGGFGCTVDVLLTPTGAQDAPTDVELAALPEPPLELRLQVQAGAITVELAR